MVAMVKINIRGTRGIVSSHKVDAENNAATVIQAPKHGKLNIELVDAATGYGPQVLVTKRVGNNLVLFFDGEDTADVILKDYYANDEIHLIGRAENGQYYEYIPVTGDVNEYTPMLMDGGSNEAVLGGEPSAFADPIADDNQFAWLPFLLFGAGAAGIGGLAYTAFKNKDSEPADRDINILINPATDKDKDGRPEISGGSSSPDSKVVITLPDGTTVTTQTDKNSNWAIEAPTSQPNGIITVTVTDSDGNSSTVTGKYEDNAAPEKPVIFANDDHLAGTAEPGSKVTVTDKETGETTTVIADDEGKWSIKPNPVAEGGNEATVVAEDPAGNVSPPVDVTRPDTMAPDNITSGIVNGVTHIEYQPAQFYVNGTEGNDSLDARGAITVDAKDGDDTIFINGTNFTSISGGEGHDTLVWDSNGNFELASVSSKISGIEAIHMVNNAAQTLVISANDVLEMTKANGETEHTLIITGDDGDANKSGAKGTVSIDKSVWTSTGSQTENGVNYDVYVHNDDTTVKLIIQNGLNVI